ncbi:hypothetical protein KY330_00650 [Candidatus Woesearchaeota archaeon]|nr:hypothetical protein [Candidatus Woesearchaeota archaeon]
MKIEINIEKKHFYMISIILVILIGTIVNATISPNIGWLPLQRIAKSSEDLTPIDENNDGKIDYNKLNIDYLDLREKATRIDTFTISSATAYGYVSTCGLGYGCSAAGIREYCKAKGYKTSDGYGWSCGYGWGVGVCNIPATCVG